MRVVGWLEYFRRKSEPWPFGGSWTHVARGTCYIDMRVLLHVNRTWRMNDAGGWRMGILWLSRRDQTAARDDEWLYMRCARGLDPAGLSR